MACVDDLKKKVPPALALFFRDLTTGLEDECGEASRSTWFFFLRAMNDHMVKPLLTVATSKGCEIKEALIFSNPYGIRLKCFRDISSWLQNDWHVCMKEFRINTFVPTNDNISGASIESNTVENERSNHAFEDLACNFIYLDEYINNAIENENEVENNNNKAYRKMLYGGPSEETTFALAHTLNDFSDQILHLLTAKGFEHVLAVKINNDPIED